MNPNTDKSSFSHALQSVLRLEGGYVNHPEDPGGETNFGIAKRYHKDLDIKNLTLDQAALIYRTEYWDALHMDAIAFETVQLHFFHIATLHGCAAAVETARLAVKLLWTPSTGRQPSYFASELACKVNGATQAHRKHFSQTINFLWCSRIHKTLAEHPARSCFRNGWMSRIDLVFAEVNQIWSLS